MYSFLEIGETKKKVDDVKETFVTMIICFYISTHNSRLQPILDIRTQQEYEKNTYTMELSNEHKH